MKSTVEKNAVELSVPYFHRLGEIQADNVQVMGGVASIALMHPDTVVKFDEKRLILNTKPDDEKTFLTQYRPDGSLRDIDVLVLSNDPEVVANAQAVADAAINGELVTSFFPMHDMSELDILAGSRFKALYDSRSVLADRYVTVGDDGKIDTLVKAVYPFEVPLDLDILDTWILEFNGVEVPIPNPILAVLNYATRPISGLRPKDANKANGIAAAMIAKAPEFKDWVYDGPGQELYLLACLLHNLRKPKDSANLLIIGDDKNMLTLYPNMQGIDPEAFMGRFADGLTPKQIAIAIKIARCKSRAVHAYEKQQKLVEFWQLHVEQNPVMTRLIKNS